MVKKSGCMVRGCVGDALCQKTKPSEPVLAAQSPLSTKQQVLLPPPHEEEVCSGDQYGWTNE